MTGATPYYWQRRADKRCVRCGVKHDRRYVYCDSCRERARLDAIAIRDRNRSRGRCFCGGEARDGFQTCARCAAKRTRSQTTLNAKARATVFGHYGYHCACCGETEPKFLALDHVNNDGFRQRAMGQRASGPAFYRRVIREGFPDAYQVLCHNCNMGKHLNGGVCPHKTGKLSEAI